MNTFVHIVRLTDFQFKKINYYSVQFEEREVCEFYDFLNRMEDIEAISEDLSNLLTWIEIIGDEYGAIKDKYFRNESIYADVSALPPGSNKLTSLNLPVKNLRLYCMVLNEHVVFLFNGGIKTVRNAKDCPNVGSYIKQANALAKSIDTLIATGSIYWNKKFTNIIFNPNIEIEL